MSDVRRTQETRRAILENSRFEGRAQVLTQIKRLISVHGPCTMTLIDVDRACDPTNLPDGPIPRIAEVVDSSNEPVGELLTWVTDGYLTALEYAWWTDDPPATLPHGSQLRFPD